MEELLDTTAILVTHAAWDHLGQAVELALVSGGGLICGPEILRQIGKTARLPESQLQKIYQGCERPVPGAVVKALHMEHISRIATETGIDSGPSLGYLISFEQGPRILHCGDTALFGDLRMYAEVYRPDIVCLGIGSTEPPLCPLPADDAAIAADWLDAPVLIPMHYLADSKSLEDFRAALARRRPDITVVPLSPGEKYVHES
jgi:L-ascorbate metabolism protein UlaG (beta-lactamase superfamily)